MKIGNYSIRTLEFGKFRLDGGAMFGVVPKVLWEKQHPADERNRIDMALRCLLISGEGRHILVDTGFGEGRSQKFKEIYAFTGAENYLDVALSELGMTKSDITDVILTHLHFDHSGGSTIKTYDEPIPTFPNAVYYIQKGQLDHARERMERDRASYLSEDYEPLLKNNQVKILDGECEILPGISAVLCHGHTPDMQLVKVSIDKKTLLYCADLVPLATQVNLAWIMAYDLYPVQTLEEKRKLMSQAVEEDWILVFEHDPFTPMGKVYKTERGYAVKPIV